MRYPVLFIILCLGCPGGRNPEDEGRGCTTPPDSVSGSLGSERALCAPSSFSQPTHDTAAKVVITWWWTTGVERPRPLSVMDSGTIVSRDGWILTRRTAIDIAVERLRSAGPGERRTGAAKGVARGEGVSDSSGGSLSREPLPVELAPDSIIITWRAELWRVSAMRFEGPTSDNVLLKVDVPHALPMQPLIALPVTPPLGKP